MSAIDINGLRVNYSDTGDGAPIVFVPGLAGCGEWFRYQSSGLSGRFRVITYDLRRARGRSEYSLDLLVDDLARLLVALKIYGAVVVGHSLGGLVALKFALSYPEFCPALVLCSTAPAFPRLPDEELLAHLLPSGVKIETPISRLIDRLFGRKTVVTDEPDPEVFLAQSVTGLDRSSLNARLRLLRETDLSPVLEDVAVPALVIAASGDRPYILSGSQLMDERIPDSQLEVIEEADRYYFYTRHDLFNAILADYATEKIARF